MTDDITDVELDPHAPDYEALRAEVDELAVLAKLDELLTEANKVQINYGIPDETPEDAYPTVAQIEADLDEFERSNAPQEPELVDAP